MQRTNRFPEQFVIKSRWSWLLAAARLPQKRFRESWKLGEAFLWVDRSSRSISPVRRHGRSPFFCYGNKGVCPSVPAAQTHVDKWPCTFHAQPHVQQADVSLPYFHCFRFRAQLSRVWSSIIVSCGKPSFLHSEKALALRFLQQSSVTSTGLGWSCSQFICQSSRIYELSYPIPRNSHRRGEPFENIFSAQQVCDTLT